MTPPDGRASDRAEGVAVPLIGLIDSGQHCQRAVVPVPPRNAHPLPKQVDGDLEPSGYNPGLSH